jgi:DNA-binding response OmpR family regulator
MDQARGIVLLVDDAEDCVPAFELAFERTPGFVIQHATTAEHALRVLNGNQPVAALITDINLPSMDGLQLVLRVRDDARYKELPIVVLSADTDPRMPARALDAGANAFFPKPYSPAAVRRKIEELIHAR